VTAGTTTPSITVAHTPTHTSARRENAIARDSSALQGGTLHWVRFLG